MAPLAGRTPLPPRRDGVRSAAEMALTAEKVGRRHRRTLMQGAGMTRLEAKWTTMPETADAVIFKNLSTLVARSRHEVLDNDHPKQFVRMVRKNVVGDKGFRVRSMPRDPGGQVDVPVQDAINAAWARQSRLGTWEVTGQMSRATFEQLWIGTVATDGSALAIIVTGEDAGPTGFALQMVDTMRLDPAHNVVLSDGRYIRAGIEYNKAGRPIAYHIADEVPGTDHLFTSYQAGGRQRVEAERVIHAFVPELVGQRRGIPWMHTALWRLRNLKGFDDAALVNARVGAAKMGFFSDPEDLEREDDEDDQEDLIIDAEPGTFQNIGRKEFHSFNPQFPEASTESFARVQLRAIASGLGVSYNTLANDLTSVNYSSLRAGAIDERDTWRMFQEWMISSFVMRVYEAWIEYAVLAKTITIKGRPLRLEQIDKYKAAEYKGRRWAWVDPLKEVTAAKAAVEGRLTSRTAYIEEATGEDAWDTFDQIAREEKDLESLGVTILTTPGAGVSGRDNDDNE